MTPDDPRHGTEAGHEQHLRDDERPCHDCHESKLIATRRRSKRKQMGYVYTTPAEPALRRIREWRHNGASYGEIADHTGIEESRVWEVANDARSTIYARTALAVLAAEGHPITSGGITRRVRALCRIGWTAPRLAAECGVHHDTIIDIRQRQPAFTARKVREGIVTGYDRIAMRQPDPVTQQERAGVTRARNYAERMGWHGPMAWEDIDAGTLATHESNNEPDHALICRIINGDTTLAPYATRAEREEVIRRWENAGHTQQLLEELTGWTVNRRRRRAA